MYKAQINLPKGMYSIMLAGRIEKSFCWNESLTGVESYATQTPVSRVRVQVTTSKVSSTEVKDTGGTTQSSRNKAQQMVRTHYLAAHDVLFGFIL